MYFHEVSACLECTLYVIFYDICISRGPFVRFFRWCPDGWGAVCMRLTWYLHIWRALVCFLCCIHMSGVHFECIFTWYPHVLGAPCMHFLHVVGPLSMHLHGIRLVWGTSYSLLHGICASMGHFVSIFTSYLSAGVASDIFTRYPYG